MKLLFNVHGYKPAYAVGGPIESVSAVAEGMVRRGHEVFVATSNRNLTEVLDVDPERTYEVNGVKVRYFGTRETLLHRTRLAYFRKSALFVFEKAYFEWLEREAQGFDVLHSQVAFLSSNYAFSSCAERCGKPLFFSQRGVLDPCRLQFRSLKKKIYLHFREMPAMRRATVLVALTDYEREVYRGLGLKNRIEVIPNGIDVKRFSEEPGDVPGAVGELLGKAQDGPVFLFLSRIHPIKGAREFVDGFIEFSKTGLPGYAVMAGPDEFGLVESFKQKIHERKLDHRFALCGPVYGHEKLALLRRADCFVLPTRSEGFSMALLEALACQCAVITTSNAHFDEIESTGAGSIVPLSASGVARAMEEFARKGRSALGRMGRKGQAFVSERFSWERIVDRYESLCSEFR